MALIFLDIETTGLDPIEDMVLEVAAVRVSSQLEPQDGFHAVISPMKSGVGIDWPQLSTTVQEMHGKNGLRAELEAGGGHDFMTAYNGLREWLERQGPAPHTLAGDSVHFDYGFLKIEMPHVAALFSHRLLDVSAFQVAREFVGLPACDIVGAAKHRATDDVMASIAKCRWHMSRLVP
jgi:oligoribonuclease